MVRIKSTIALVALMVLALGGSDWFACLRGSGQKTQRIKVASSVGQKQIGLASRGGHNEFLAPFSVTSSTATPTNQPTPP
jgi:hypothetical protein